MAITPEAPPVGAGDGIPRKGRKSKRTVSTSQCDAEAEMKSSKKQKMEESKETVGILGKEDRIKLHIGNLPDKATSETLRPLFESHGEVSDCYVPGKGFGFVTMINGNGEEADAAIAELNGCEYMGANISVKVERIDRRKSKPKKPVFDKEDIRVKANAAVHAMYELLKKNEKNQLLAGTGSKLKLSITSIKLQQTQKGTIKIGLPYPYLTSELGAHICLVTPDKKGYRKDSEESSNHYKSILKQKKIKYVTEVMPLWEIRAEYKPHEMRNRLSNRCDIMLADSRVIKDIMPILGKPFVKKKKFPVSVDMEAKDLDKE